MPSSHTDEVIKESHPDWKSFKGKAAQGVVFTNFAYKQTDEEMQAMAESIPEGYELFLMTDHVEDNRESSFRCAAFVNQKTKEIVFATAGTRPGLDQKGVDDLYDDVLLIAQEKPRKMNPAQILNDMILDSLGDSAKDYKFHYTGHSLGAAMAEMQAADMDIKLTQKGLKQRGNREQITAVTFENPGTKAILEKMYNDAGLPKENVEKLNLCEFNNRNNIINSLNEQAGRTYTIVPHSQKRNPSMAQMVFEVVAKYVAELSPILGKALSLLAPGGVDISLVGDHSLSNFDEVFVKQEGSVKNSEGQTISLEEAYSGIKPVEYDSRVANKISSMKIENGNIGKQEFSMNKLNLKTGKLDRLVFSSEEVKVATHGLLKAIPQKGSMTERVRQEMSLGKEVTALKLPTAGEIANPGTVRGV